MDWDILKEDLEDFDDTLEMAFTNADNENDLDEIVQLLKVKIDTAKIQWVKRVLNKN